MIESSQVINKTEYIEELSRRLDRMLQNAPIRAMVKIIEPKIIISVINQIQDIEYIINYEMPVKKNLFHLRRLLIDNAYPILICVINRTEKLTALESEDLIEQGMSVDEALNKAKVVSEETKYKITKVIIKRDELFVKNLETNQELRYKLNMPISVFLKRLREKWTPEEAGDIFMKKGKFVEKIYSEEDWKKINRK